MLKITAILNQPGADSMLQNIYDDILSFPSALWRIVIFTLFGILIGLDYMIGEIKKEGTWKINLSKLIFIGLPSAYMVICFLAMWFNGISFIVIPFIFHIRGGVPPNHINYEPGYLMQRGTAQGPC